MRVSGNKTLALRDLSAREASGEIPSLRKMSTMHQDDIVAALVPVRGIGRWTVEMMLMSRLGRPDVLPVDDLGIRKGVQRARSAGHDVAHIHLRHRIIRVQTPTVGIDDSFQF